MQSLPRRLSRCMLESEPFQPGAEYISLLLPDGSRKDYCVKCWERSGQIKEGAFWKGTIPLRKGKKECSADELRIERAIGFFLDVEEKGLKYVLALYLLRKRRLARRTQTLYEMVETGELFDVPAPYLTKEEQEALAAIAHEMIANEQCLSN